MLFGSKTAFPTNYNDLAFLSTPNPKVNFSLFVTILCMSPDYDIGALYLVGNHVQESHLLLSPWLNLDIFKCFTVTSTIKYFRGSYCKRLSLIGYTVK